MELQEFRGSHPVVSLEPGECSLLASLCDLAREEYCKLEDEPIQTAALTLGAAFRGLAIAGISACELTPDLYERWNGEMEGLGLAGVAQGLNPAASHRHRLEREQAKKAPH